MKKLLLSSFLILLFSFCLYSQKLNVSDYELDEFVEQLKAGNSVNTKMYYLWSGTITKIDNITPSEYEVTLTKAKWIDKSTLNAYKAILKISDLKTIEKINKTGLNKRIVVIVEVINFRDNIIPICSPLIIKEN